MFAKPSPEDLQLVEEILSPPLMALFLRQSAGEQVHSISILRRIGEQGQAHEDLLLAALLHDVGKSRYPLSLWERALIVMVKSLFPERVKDWGSGELRGWNKPFIVAEQHAAWGAKMVEQTGASPLAVELIRRHQEPRSVYPVMNEISDGNGISNDHADASGKVTLEDALLYRLKLFDDES